MTNAQSMRILGRKQRGLLYDHGDHGPPSNMWDCSGLTMEMAELCGLKWPHSSHTQYYSNSDLPYYGAINSMPRDRDCFVFKYGERTNGSMGMIHVGYYCSDASTELQAGGKSPFVSLEVYEQNITDGMTPMEAVENSLWKDHPTGTKKSTVWEQDFNENYWTHWRRGDWMDAEASDGPVEPPNDTPTTIRKGSEGTLVTTLQNLLNAWNNELETLVFDALKVDGKFGPLTYDAVREYQEKNNLKVDGIVGKNTWTSLLEPEPSAEPAETPEETLEETIALQLLGLTAEQADKVIALAEQYPNVTVIEN